MHKTAYLIDAGREKAGFDAIRFPKVCSATAFMATSPNKALYDRWIAKRVVMDRWTPLELLAARHVMAPDMAVEMVRQRIVIAGLAPRYVFNDIAFEVRKLAVEGDSLKLPNEA